MGFGKAAACSRRRGLHAGEGSAASVASKAGGTSPCPSRGVPHVARGRQGWGGRAGVGDGLSQGCGGRGGGGCRTYLWCSWQERLGWWGEAYEGACSLCGEEDRRRGWGGCTSLAAIDSPLRHGPGSPLSHRRVSPTGRWAPAPMDQSPHLVDPSRSLCFIATLLRLPGASRRLTLSSPSPLTRDF